MFKNNIHAFLLASSFPGVFITLSYLGYNYAKNDKPKDVSFELFSLLVPIAFGIFGVINYHAIAMGSFNSLIVGAVFGLLLSIIGRFYLKVPAKLFMLDEDKQDIVHFYAPVLYALIFYIIISPIQDVLIPREAIKKSVSSMVRSLSSST